MQTDQPTITAEADCEPDIFLIVHPLNDRPEQKVGSGQLPPMVMTRSVRISLFTLRGYLILMMFLLLYHILDLAGLFSHH